MTIGDLRKRIDIQAEQSTPDGAGGYALAWTTIASIWAEIAPVSGGEKFVHGRLQGRVTHKITMRWLDGITADMRVAFNNRLFNIRAVINVNEANQWAILLVEEGAAT